VVPSSRSPRPRPVRARLQKPLERAVADGHPWVFRDALDGGLPAEPGREVVLLDRRGRFLARGVADQGPIALRIWTVRDVPVDDGLLTARIEQALRLRDELGLGGAGAPEAPAPGTDAYRLLHGEGDRLPGVVCDRYGERAVLRFDGRGAEARFEDVLREVLPDRLGRRGIRTVLKRAGRGRDKQVAAWAPTRGPGEPPRHPVPVSESGMRLLVDLVDGQKTGLFLDQRASRARVRALAEGSSVLNLYGYTGGFSLAAALGGARQVDTVDVAADALALGVETFRQNGLADRVPHRTWAEDVPRFLRQAADRGETWDLVIADPPSFAPKAAARAAALSAYRELHRACVGRVRPGGLYLAASCSSHVDRQAFEDTLAKGARTADRALAVLDRWEAPPDHPRLLAFPEGNYLTVILARVTPR